MYAEKLSRGTAWTDLVWTRRAAYVAVCNALRWFVEFLLDLHCIFRSTIDANAETMT